MNLEVEVCALIKALRDEPSIYDDVPDSKQKEADRLVEKSNPDAYAWGCLNVGEVPCLSCFKIRKNTTDNYEDCCVSCFDQDQLLAKLYDDAYGIIFGYKEKG